MRIAILASAILLMVSVAASADQFTWLENFESPQLAPYWQLSSGDGGFVGVVEDPTQPGNHVLRVDSQSGGFAFASLIDNGVFQSLASDQPVTATIRFYLESDFNSWFYILGTVFTSVVDYDDWYGYDGINNPFTVPVGEWVTFKYEFIPDQQAGTTHKVYMNDVLMGEFDNYPALHQEGEAFFVGDDDPSDWYYGSGMWDDLQVVGATTPVPEPTSFLILTSGLGLLIRRRRK